MSVFTLITNARIDANAAQSFLANTDEDGTHRVMFAEAVLDHASEQLLLLAETDRRHGPMTLACARNWGLA